MDYFISHVKCNKVKESQSGGINLENESLMEDSAILCMWLE